MHGVYKPKRNDVSSSERVREVRRQARRVKDQRVNRQDNKAFVLMFGA